MIDPLQSAIVGDAGNLYVHSILSHDGLGPRYGQAPILPFRWVAGRYHGSGLAGMPSIGKQSRSLPAGRLLPLP